MPALERLVAEKRIHLPWVDGADLRLAAVTDLERDLRPGWRGVREPVEGLRPPVSADAPDGIEVAIVPGVAFDRAGNRLGYGGGHFDRLLARLGAEVTVVGVAFDVQVVDHLPVEPHDVPVDLLVTEGGLHRR